MNQYKSIQLIKGRDQSLLRFHPWVFSGAIKSMDDGITDGEVVNICDFKKNIIGKGHYQSGTSIAIRVLTTIDEPIDSAFWSKRIKNAIDFRKNILNFPSITTNTFRLIHGEGDLLPGLIIDIYNDTAVIQCHSKGMMLSQGQIRDALIQESGGIIQYVYAKNKESLPQSEMENRWLTEP
ncbi:MAG TPA: class I SAM-dependent rRNA methyltransferase, partial [Saprospiraceae bacterium]|nr:class I SAM-dependent rRNA methyltransferase [Saprospiraceae bacterium]